MSIYLLYCDDDSSWVRRLVTDLREADLPVWFADDEIRIGDSIPEANSIAIQSARVFLVIVSESATASRSFTHKLSGSFHQVLADSTRRVMPVLRESCELPPILQDRRSLDLVDYSASVGTLITELWEIYKETDPAAPDIPGYESFKYIGEGGFGVVYKCFSSETSQECAIKIAKAHSSVLPIDAAIATRIPESPHIVPVIRSGHWRKRPFVVMPYVGRSLKSAIRLGLILHTDVNRILQIAEGILLGLSDAHAAGIAHQDIKPSNILLDDLGRPLICDFGLATKIQYAQFRYSTVVRGTVCYMSPEQQLALDTNHQTDIYSFGAVLYELLTNEKPFGRFRDPSEINPSIPPSLDGLVSRCLEVSLTKRYRSAKDVLRDLSESKKTLELGARLRSRVPPHNPIFLSDVMKEATYDFPKQLAGTLYRRPSKKYEGAIPFSMALFVTRRCRMFFRTRTAGLYQLLVRSGSVFTRGRERPRVARWIISVRHTARKRSRRNGTAPAPSAHLSLRMLMLTGLPPMTDSSPGWLARPVALVRVSC